MMMDEEDLDLQFGEFADFVRTAKTLYERQFQVEATVCIKLTGQWNIELYPRGTYNSPVRVFGAGQRLGVAIERCLRNLSLSVEKKEPVSLAQILEKAWRTR